MSDKEEEEHIPNANSVNASVIIDEINDFITDNDPEAVKNSNDLMLTCIDKIESMRRELKTCFTILKSEVDAETYETKYSDSFQKTKDIVSAYIREANQLIQKGNAHTQSNLWWDEFITPYNSKKYQHVKYPAFQMKISNLTIKILANILKLWYRSLQNSKSVSSSSS